MGKLMLSLILGALAVSAADDVIPLHPSAAPAAPAEVLTTRGHSGVTLWRLSVVALGASNIMDVQSSWGKRELNPTLAGNGGAFGPKGALLKLGITGGVVGIEFLVLRHRPSMKVRRVLSVINFGDAGLTGTMAARNWQVPGR